MVEVARYPVIPLQILSQLLALFPRDTIYDAAFALEACLEHCFDVVLDAFDRLFVTDLVKQVRPVEATLEVNDFLGDA